MSGVVVHLQVSDAGALGYVLFEAATEIQTRLHTGLTRFELHFVTKITNTTFERMVHTLKTHVLRIDLNFVKKTIDTTCKCMWPVLRCIEALFNRCQMFVMFVELLHGRIGINSSIC